MRSAVGLKGVDSPIDGPPETVSVTLSLGFQEDGVEYWARATFHRVDASGVDAGVLQFGKLRVKIEGLPRYIGFEGKSGIVGRALEGVRRK